MTSVKIPESTVTIEGFAFSGCEKLTSVSISSSVTNIGNAAFTVCANLTGINVDDKNPAYCSVDGVLFDKNKTFILAVPGARSGAYVIPDSVDTIKYNAFYGCKNLTSVSMPNSVTTIGNWAFADCDGLTSVTIPSSVTKMENGAFASCSSLKDINVEKANPAYSSLSGVLFDKNQTVLWSYPCGRAGSYIVPKSVTEIKTAFKGCENLQDVTLLNGVTNIGYEAFCDCSNLTKVTIADSVIRFDNRVFTNCTNLKEVYYSGDVTQWNAIEGVTNALSDGVTVHYHFDDISSTAYYSQPT